jgi:hypothetical protein
MGLLDYQKRIVGYHGTDAKVVDDVLSGKAQLEYSKNKHDWLGHGIYFWEHGPERALEWAKWRMSGRGGGSVKIREPAVIGAFIQLGFCFDLLDIRNTKMLQALFPTFKADCEKSGLPIPENKPSFKNDPDHTKRYLDGAFLNWVMQVREQTENVRYHTVRCIFSEGEPAFQGSLIMLRSHIQVAVRDPQAILGFFRPNVDFSGI